MTLVRCVQTDLTDQVCLLVCVDIFILFYFDSLEHIQSGILTVYIIMCVITVPWSSLNHMKIYTTHM